MGFPRIWYELSGADHFWMKWRLQVWLQRMREQGIDLSGGAKALDIGCGVGTFSRQVEAVSGWTVDGADLDEEAIRLARGGRGRARLLDIFSFPKELMKAYHHVFLFDVIEHVSNPREFIEASLRYLRPGGLLHVNVPALQSLYSAYDAEAGHLRRYDLKTLALDLKEANVSQVRAGYWGLSLIPYAMLRKWLIPASQDGERVIRRGFAPPGKISNLLLHAQRRMETFFGARMPLGTSIMLSARSEG